MLLITFSRQTGSLGDEIARQLAEKLEVTHINRDYTLKNWFPEIATRHEIHMLSESPGYYLKKSSKGMTFQEFLENRLKQFIKDESAVISGLGSQIIFHDHPSALHVKVIASQKIRTERIMSINNLIDTDAAKILEVTDRRHRRYIQAVYGRDWSDPLLYDLILNTDHIGLKDSVELLYHHGTTRSRESSVESAPENTAKPIVFKNDSEEEFAKILDMYNLEWDYEPRTFPLKWDSEGNITQAFSPDFYLPRFDTYIELTIMNQKYTSVKRKKQELLKKLYPGTNISIVYKSDFHSLIRRFAEWGED